MSRLLTTFKKLVSIDSPTGHEQAVADFLIDHFTQRNIIVERDHTGNVFAKIYGFGEPVFLASHMDTVEPGRNIIPVVKDDIITAYGDTVLGADNKSTLAVLLEVIERLKEKKHRPLEILFTVGEESTDPGAATFDYTKVTAKRGLVADIALPVGTIVIGSPAYARFDIVITGKSGHAAFPEKATNVIPVLGSIFSEVTTGKLDEQTILNIGTVTAGSVRNAVPGTATLRGEIRSFDENVLQKQLELFFEKVKTAARKFAVQLDIDYSVDNPTYLFEKQDQYVQQISYVFQQQDIQPTLVKSWSVSDANIFNTKGLQVINIGDGARNTHTRDESIALADMEKLVTLFQLVCQQ
ncbi:MAG TPA: M20/M25/M40 family metallo-hydrolase [Candidatus Acidoferrales bacterium]|nr:M20/M25/M40 family metallo-hydrolase [Candidatus Acidoferrales bacterium]